MENITWLKDVLFLLPIAGLIWKAAMLSAKVKQNEQDIAEMKTLSQKQNEAIIASLNKLQETMTEIRTDVSILKVLRDKEEKNNER